MVQKKFVYILLMLVAIALPAQAGDHQRNGRQAAPAARQQRAVPQRAPAVRPRVPGQVYQGDHRYHENRGRFLHSGNNYQHGRQVMRYRYRYNDGHVHYYAYDSRCCYCGFVPVVVIGAVTGAIATGTWVAIAAPRIVLPRQIECSVCRQWWEWSPAYEGQPTPGLPPCSCWDGYR